MEQIQCWHCGDFVPDSPRHKEQYYCMKPKCRRAKKAAWKRKKIREDAEYRLNHRASNKKWAEANPGYWKAYRKRNPKKAERNHILQNIRNRRRSKKGKADAKGGPSVIAKVYALKVYMYEILTPYQ